jgi:hypothetical protein
MFKHPRSIGVVVVIRRFIGASVRALLVISMILVPAMILPMSQSVGASLIALVAVITGAFTWSEYFSTYQTLVTFRAAAPFNRLRFIFLFGVITMTSVLVKDFLDPSEHFTFVQSLGVLCASVLDFQFSPVRIMSLLLPSGTPQVYVDLLMHAAGLAFVLAVMCVGCFAVLVSTRRWPEQKKVFNIWVNFPLMDHVSEEEIVPQLRRDSTVYYSLGILMPFLIPVVFKLAAPLFNAMVLLQAQTLIWVIAFWAFIPVSCLMRGIAMSRIATMIEASTAAADPVVKSGLHA